MTPPSENPDWEESFRRIWEHREEVIYPGLFGPQREGIFTIPWDRLEHGKVPDPRWNTCGVFKFKPTPTRSSWLYVSSGLSNAWFDEHFSADVVSGFGCEFVLETTEDALWPIHRLHQLMAYQIGLSCGVYPGSPPLACLDRIPMRTPIDWKTSALTYVMLASPIDYPGDFTQQSGRADFLGVAGISESEAAFGREHGSSKLLAQLIDHRAFPVIDPTRKSLDLA